MTVAEIADLFPNGLHDAEVESLHIDHEKRTVTMTVDVWVGSLEDPGEEREAYRRGTLAFSGMHYCATEGPSTPPAAAFTCRFWVDEWNGFVHLAAQDVSLTWSEETADGCRPCP